MSDRVLAIVRIGGQLDASRADILINAINDMHVYAYTGDVFFEPVTIEDLMKARTPKGHLELTDDSAPWGEMLDITMACHELGLSYRLWSETSGDFGPEVRIWTPEMAMPLVMHGDQLNPDTILIELDVVADALAALRGGRLEEAEELLVSVPTIPELPTFEVVEEGADAGCTTVNLVSETSSQIV